MEFAGRKITQVDRTEISTVIFGAYVHQHVVAVDRAGRSGDTDSGYANVGSGEKRMRRRRRRRRTRERSTDTLQRGDDVTVTVTILAYRSGTGGR